MCPKNLRILRVPTFTENDEECLVANTIVNEVYNLSACAKFTECTFQIAAIDNVEIVAEIQFVYRNRKAKEKLQRKKKELKVKVQLKQKNKGRRDVKQETRVRRLAKMTEASYPNACSLSK